MTVQGYLREWLQESVHDPNVPAVVIARLTDELNQRIFPDRPITDTDREIITLAVYEAVDEPDEYRRLLRIFTAAEILMVAQKRIEAEKQAGP